MFRWLRVVAILILIFLLLITVTGSLYCKRYAIDNISDNLGKQKANDLISIFLDRVWDQYYPIIGFVINMSEQEMSNYVQYNNFLVETKNFFYKSNADKVVIYRYDAHKLLEINKQDISFDLMHNEENISDIINKIRKNNVKLYSFITTGVSSKHEHTTKRSYIKLYFPIKTTHQDTDFYNLANAAKAIVEVSYDITKSIDHISVIQFTITGIILLLLLFVGSLIIIGSYRLEKFIIKLQQESNELAAARITAESENDTKSQFLANISHELRTPLIAIIGFSKVMKMEELGKLDNDKYKEFANDIHISGKHLLKLINDILDFSKAKEGKLEFDYGDVDVIRIIRIATKMVVTNAEENNIGITQHFVNDHIVINSDAKRLKQIIVNILSNAVKFTSAGGKIYINVTKDEATNTVNIKITDTGVGMETQDIAKALSHFGQIDNKLSKKYQGTGLGLPFSKKITEMLGGKFLIESKIGVGTSITLHFNIQKHSQ